MFSSNEKAHLPVGMEHLFNRADLTPLPLSGSHQLAAAGKCNNVVGCYFVALTEQASPNA